LKKAFAAAATFGSMDKPSHGRPPPMFLALFAAAVATAPVPVREPLATFHLAKDKAVHQVEVMRVQFLPGQAMPRHVHPAPVVCLVQAGAFTAKIGDAPETRYATGEATFEPAGVVIGYFRNVSATEPATLVCAFLAGAEDKTLSTMLPEPAP
jgi:quercetin dioxygenase-like cupin family protein